MQSAQAQVDAAAGKDKMHKAKSDQARHAAVLAQEQAAQAGHRVAELTLTQQRELTSRTEQLQASLNRALVEVAEFRTQVATERLARMAAEAQAIRNRIAHAEDLQDLQAQGM